MEYVNRICPKCKNGNYIVSLEGKSEMFRYKCINCNHYLNDEDFIKQTEDDSMKDTKPPMGAEPYYVSITNRIRDLCLAVIRQMEMGNVDHNKVKLRCKEILMLNEMDRNLRYEEEQKVWAEDKDGKLHEMT